VAVLGPNANALRTQYGNYSGTPSAQHQISIIDGIRQAVGAEHVIADTQSVPIAGNIALAEPVAPECLFQDASKNERGLGVAYATKESGLLTNVDREVALTGAIHRLGLGAGPTLAARMGGVIVPPVSGEYTFGGRGRDAFRILIDGKVVVDQMLGGPLRTASTLISLEKDKAYKVLVEFSQTSTSGVRASWYGGDLPTINPNLAGGRGAAAGSAPAIPGEGVAGAPGAATGGRGGRGGRGGGQAYGATAEAPGIATAGWADSDLFQIAWTKPTAEGMPAMTNGQSLYGEAVELAKKADAVVLVMGLDSSQEGEEFDRPAIELPQIQEGLIRAVTRAAGKKPVVVVNCSGSAVALNWADENVPAIIQAWYPGQRGDAVADVLFGKYNPAGRLPLTFYKATSDLPSFVDYKMVDRTYRYFTKPVLYPFGYGLSYSTFEYSGLSARASAGTGEDVKVSANVKNTSSVDGEEVVQCYLNREVSAIDAKSLPEVAKMTDEQATLASTPRKALVGFARVPLKAGESKTVTFTVTTQQLSLVVGKDGKREVRPGALQLQVGGSSAMRPGVLTQTLALDGAAKAPLYHFVAPMVK